MDLFGKKKIADLSLQVKALQQTVIADLYSNWQTRIYPSWKSYKEIQAYATMDDIYSVISYCAEKTALIPLYAYEVVNEKKARRLKSADPLSIRSQYLQIKALEDLEEGDRFFDFFESPFLGMSKFEGFVAIYTYLYAAGEAFVYKDAEIRLGVNSNVETLHVIPPENITLVISGTFPKRVIGYEYEEAGQKFPIAYEDLIHIKYFHPGCNEWRGLSPIKVLAKRLTRLEGAMNASVAQLQNGGLPGILFNETDDGTTTRNESGQEVTVSDMHKTNFANFLRNADNKGAPYFTGGKLGYIPIGLKLTDMEVSALAGIDFKKICNAFHISDILFNNDKGSVEANVKEMKKSAYTDCFLPNCFRMRDAFNLELVTEFRDKRRQLQEDISDIPVLQDDMKMQADALDIMWWVSPNEKREIQKFDKSDDTLMDEIIIPSGKMLLIDLTPPIDLPVTDDYKPAPAKLPTNGKYQNQ